MILRIRAFALLIAVALMAAGSLAMPSATLAQEDAVPLGDTASVSGLDITVLEWVPDATGMVTVDMVAETPLAEDETYVLARLRVGNTGENPDVAMGMNLPTFGVAGSSRVGYLSDTCGSLYQSPLMITEIAAGAEGEIEICWRVPRADLDSLSMFVREYDPSLGSMLFQEDEASNEPVGITWFSLGNDPIPAYDGGQVLDGDMAEDNSLENPIPVGSVGSVGDYEVSVLSVNADATDAVMALDEMNEPPGPDQQYLMAEVAIGYTGDRIGSVDDLLLDPMFEIGTYYESMPCQTAYQYGPAEMLFPGARTTVTVCTIVDSANAESLVLMASLMSDMDSMPPFFSLQP